MAHVTLASAPASFAAQAVLSTVALALDNLYQALSVPESSKVRLGEVVYIVVLQSNMRKPFDLAVESATVSSPVLGTIPYDGLTAFATEALQVVTLSVTVRSENGRASTYTFTGTEVPFNVHITLFGTVTVAYVAST